MKYECLLCGKTFDNRVQVRRHIRLVHLKEKVETKVSEKKSILSLRYPGWREAYREGHISLSSLIKAVE